MRFLLALFLAVSFVAAPFGGLAARAQQGQTGVVIVIVTNGEDGKPLADAVVTMTKNGTPPSPPIVKKADADGKVRFSELIPGKYTVKVTAKGFEPQGDLEYQVEAGIEAEQPVGLSKENVIDVSGNVDKPLVEEGSTPAGKFTPKEIRTLPVEGRDALSLPPTPGVLRTGIGTSISIKGGREDQSAVFLNGAFVTDPATGTPVVNVPLEAVESTQVFTNPYLPEYSRFSSGVIKIETRGGSPKWEFGFNDLFPEPRFRGGKLFGFANVSPRVNFSGPLVKDKLFFAQGLEFIVDKSPVRGLPNPNNEIRKRAFRSFSQFDYLISSKQSLTATVNFARRNTRFLGLDFFNPQPVAPNMRADDIGFAVSHRFFRENGARIDTQFNYKRIDTDIFGNGPATMVITPVGRTGNFFGTTDRLTERYQMQSSYEMQKIEAFGRHQVKFGFDVNAMRNRGTVTNRPVEIRRTDGTLAQRIEYGRVGDLSADNIEVSGYAQDQWTILPNLQLDFGLRIETQQAATTLNLAPRIGLSYSPGKSGNTVFRAGYGLFYDKILLNALAFRSLPNQIVTTFAADGVTAVDGPRVFANQIARNPTNLRSGADFRVPYNSTLKLEFAQKITNRVLIRLGYTDSRTYNDLFVTPFNAGTGGVVSLSNSGQATYKAFDAIADIKFTRDHELTVAYTRSKARGQQNDFISYYGDFPDPVVRPDQFSNANVDTPNRFFARGRFEAPLGLTFAPIIEWRNGFPYSLRDQQQNFVGIRNADNVRFPNFFSLDLAVTKTFQIPEWLKPNLFGKKPDIKSAQFTVTIFNVTNHFNPRNTFANTGAPQFGTFFANYRRFFRIDFGINF